MNPLLQQILYRQIRQRKKGETTGIYTRGEKFHAAKMLYRAKVFLRNEVRGFMMMIIGALCAGFGLQSFLLPNGFIDGGVTGISLLVAEVSGWPLPMLLVAINIPFMVMAYQQFGRQLAIKATGAIVFLALCVAFIHYPVITSDKLLVAVFGGFFLGAGIGLAMRGGAVLDGTEILALFISRKTGLTIGDFILVINVAIFSIAAFVLGLEVALYSILTYLSASKTIDFIIEGIEEYTGVTIISRKSEEICQVIIQKLRRGVTIYAGKRGFGKQGENNEDTDILFTVITRLEISDLKTEIEAIDPNAFVVMASVKDTHGGMIKRRPLHK